MLHFAIDEIFNGVVPLAIRHATVFKSIEQTSLFLFTHEFSIREVFGKEGTTADYIMEYVLVCFNKNENIMIAGFSMVAESLSYLYCFRR
jgi:hypothetical protein